MKNFAGIRNAVRKKIACVNNLILLAACHQIIMIKNNSRLYFQGVYKTHNNDSIWSCSAVKKVLIYHYAELVL